MRCASAASRCTRCYGSADLGLIAYETGSGADEGLILDEALIVEIVRPGTGDPVPAGRSRRGRRHDASTRDYPLIRFATGDLSAVLPGTSPCGRTNVRIKGWMGRADQTTKVRGDVRHARRRWTRSCAAIPEILRARLVVAGEAGNDRMTLHVEVRERPSAAGATPSSPRSATSPSCAARSSSSPPAACRTTAR